MSKRLIIILLLSGVLILTATALAMMVGLESKLSSGHSMIDESQSKSSAAQSKAIEEAQEWSPPPDQMCTMALTDAIHAETEAEYTFPSGCLAPGWEPVR